MLGLAFLALGMSAAGASRAAADSRPPGACLSKPGEHRTLKSFIGVNTHLSWLDTAWGRGDRYGSPLTKIQGELDYLGVSQLRDGVPATASSADEYVALAAHGVRFLLLQTLHDNTVRLHDDIVMMQSLERAQPGMIEGFEGINEFARSNYFLDGLASRNNAQWGLADAKAAMAAAAPLRNVAISLVAPTSGLDIASPDISDFVDCGNWHIYGGVAEPLLAHIAAGLAAASRVAPNRPVILSEMGISSAPRSAAKWGVAGSEKVQAEIVIDALLDAFVTTADKVFLYELMDDRPGTEQEDMFGLFHPDGTPKQAAVALRNLLAVAGDDTLVDTADMSPGKSRTAKPPPGPSLIRLGDAPGSFKLIYWDSGAAPLGAAPRNPGASTAKLVSRRLPSDCHSATVYHPFRSAIGVTFSSRDDRIASEIGPEPVVVVCRQASRG